ncbi:MAG: hypothetical protein GY723_14415 [bacterium]|nr:hypothetical protein [bacterium]MCP5069965.1 hypothetical protein [bacterium]
MLASAAALSSLLFVLAGGAVGVRLTALAWRTRGLAESLLGPGLFLIVGLGYPIVMVGTHLTKQGLTAGPLLKSCSLVVMSIGWSCVWTFTWRVFRPDARWARVITLLAFVAFGVFAVENIHRSLTIVRPQDALAASWGGLGHHMNAMTILAWSGFESLRYYGLLKRRMALGMGNPVVANRFLLWGIVSIFCFISLSGPLAAGLLGLDFLSNPFVLLSLAIGGSTAAIGLFLAFLPPEAYLKRIEKRARASA